MKPKIVLKNVVFVGQFNPLNYGKNFFSVNKIIDVSDFSAESMETTHIVQFSTNQLGVTILPNQFIIAELIPSEDGNILKKTVENIVRNIGSSIITACGFNFNWILKNEKVDLPTFSKELFYNKSLTVYQDFFSAPDSAFGIYCSTNFKGARLKMEGKPMQFLELVDGEYRDGLGIDFAFNYDIDFKITKENLDFYVNLYDEYRKHCRQIISTYEN